MSLDLLDFEEQARKSIKAFWGGRGGGVTAQQKLDGVDVDNRSAVVGGKNLDGFIHLFRDIVIANGLPKADINISKGGVTLPGYYRPTKQWDMVVNWKGRLVAAIELKSQVGSLGNNFNNRLEEALGSATDLAAAHRAGAFGADAPRPFLGWMMLLGDEPAARRPINDRSRDFGVMPEFKGASYSTRYEILCRKMVKDGHYDGTCFLLSPNTAADDGAWEELSPETSLRAFVSGLAAHCARIGAEV